MTWLTRGDRPGYKLRGREKEREPAEEEEKKGPQRDRPAVGGGSRDGASERDDMNEFTKIRPHKMNCTITMSKWWLKFTERSRGWQAMRNDASPRKALLNPDFDD